MVGLWEFAAVFVTVAGATTLEYIALRQQRAQFEFLIRLSSMCAQSGSAPDRVGAGISVRDTTAGQHRSARDDSAR